MGVAEPFSFLDFNNQSVMVTGAYGGIGKEVIDLLVSLGALVHALDIKSNDSNLEKVFSYELDITDRESLKSTCRTIFASSIPPRYLVHTVGGSFLDTFDELSEQGWDDEINLNLNCAYALVREFLQQVKQDASLVLVSSVNGLNFYGNPGYSAAKAGLNSLVKSVATVYGKNNIRCNAVCPGSVYTELWEDRVKKNPNIIQQVTAHYPMKKMVTAKEVANSIVFMLSNFSSGVTGVSLPVDAGLSSTNLGLLNEITE